MNKKIFATALFAIAAFVSTGASAAITYGNSVGAGVQTDDALVNPGGSAQRANDLTIVAGTSTTDVPADSEIIIRLPAGLNFSGAPTYLVSPATPTQGLTLKDNTAFGDPTLGENVGVELFDTDADGGMDRAVVTVSAAANVGDELIISSSVAANSDATTGLKKASIIVNGGLAQTIDVVEVTNDVISGVISATGTDLVTVDQKAYVAVDVSTPDFGVVIPAGAENGDTVTLNVAGKVQWDAGTSTLTISNVYTPLSVLPLTGSALVTGVPSVAVAGATSTVTLTVQGAPMGGFANDVAVSLSLNSANITAGSAVGDVGLTVGGTAGVAGSANLFAVKANGSTGSLAAGEKVTTLVAGSDAAQALPAITITENFDLDAFDNAAGSTTVTITANAGLTFSPTATLTISGGGATINTQTLTSTNTAWVIDFATNAGPTLTITIDGMMATAGAATSGDLAVTLSGNKTSAASNAVIVANSVPVGTVTVSGPSGTLPKIGAKAAGNTAVFTLNETTYGAITRVNYEEVETQTGTEITRAFFRVTPTNAKITAVTILSPGVAYTAPGSDPTFGSLGVATGACVVEAALSPNYICEVVTESTSLVAGTDTVSVQITYTADGMVGDTVSMTLDGNAGVAGSGDVATLVESTTSSAPVITLLSEGEVTSQTLGTLTIKETFPGGLGAGTFRILAPAGVVFAGSNLAIALPGTATPTAIVDTFAVGDTLELSTGATPSVTITADVVIAGTVSGYMDFQILDGTSGLTPINKTGLTEVSAIALGYADSSLDQLDAGAAIALNVGFSDSGNTVSGGLVPADGYTVASSNTGTVTASLDGTTLTVTGVAVGSANVTVTDELGGTDVVVVTVSPGATQPAAPKTITLSGASTAATFTGGATADGGDTYATEFTTGDDVTLLGTVNVDPADVGEDGEILVIVRSTDTGGAQTWAYLDVDSNYAALDPTDLGSLGAHIVATPLGSTYNITIFSGALAAGTHRVALGYSVGNEIVYAGKALQITVTE